MAAVTSPLLTCHGRSNRRKWASDRTRGPHALSLINEPAFDQQPGRTDFSQHRAGECLTSTERQPASHAGKRRGSDSRIQCFLLDTQTQQIC